MAETNSTFEEMERIKDIQRMIRILPNEAGSICIADLFEIFSQEG